MPLSVFRSRGRRRVARRRRWRATGRVRRLKNYGRRLRRGLDTVVSPATVRDFTCACPWSATQTFSDCIRLDPFGLSGNENNCKDKITTDARFVQMCALYDEFRILSWSVDIVLNGPSFNNGSGATATTLQNAGRMTFMAQLYRRHDKSTPFWTADQMVKAPGTIVAKPRGSSIYPAVKLMVFPATLSERTCWIPTTLTSDLQIAQFYAGTQLDFSPCIDLIAYTNKPPAATNSVWTYTVISRFRVAFRKGLGLSGTTAKNVVQVLQEKTDLYSLNPKLRLDVNATFVRNQTGKNNYTPDDDADAIYDTVAADIADGAAARGVKIEEPDEVKDEALDDMASADRVPVKEEGGGTVGGLIAGGAALLGTAAGAVAAAAAEAVRNRQQRVKVKMEDEL